MFRAMPVTVASTSAELGAAQALFEEAIPGIAPDAVPRTSWGQKNYDVTVAQFRGDDGELFGAALTCRAQAAVTSVLMGDPLGFRSVLDQHSELDLIAVRPNSRSKGVGSALIEFLEERLVAAGVRVWFGNVTPGLDVDRLASFYGGLGFTVGEPGARLPRLLGKDWAPPLLAEKPAFYFYKTLGDDTTHPGLRHRVARPPDPKKARRAGKSKKRKR